MDVYSGSPRVFYSQLIDGQDMMKCLDEVFEHADGTGCAYLDVSFHLPLCPLLFGCPSCRLERPLTRMGCTCSMWQA